MLPETSAPQTAGLHLTLRAGNRTSMTHYRFTTAIIAAAVAAGIGVNLPAAELTPAFSAVPGKVIFHSPATSQIYVGSPGIVQLPNGNHLAKCDEFGPKCTEQTIAVTRVFRSTDRGSSWSEMPAVHGIYWATIFVHSDAVYLMGPRYLWTPTCWLRRTGRAQIILRVTVSGSKANSADGLRATLWSLKTDVCSIFCE